MEIIVNKFNVPPGWPAAEPGWIPPEGWVPDASWPAAPEGWQFWTIEADPSPVPPSSAQTITVPSPALPAKRRRWLAPTLTGIAGLVLGIIIGSAVGSGSSTSGAAPAAGGGQATSVTTPKLVPSSTPTPAPKAPAVAAIGTPVRDGKFEFTVGGITCGLSEVGTAPLTKAAQGQFCLVDVTVKNIGDQAQPFFGSNQYAYNAAAQKYTADTEAAIYLPEANSLFVPINPGNQLTGKVIFDIPAGATLTKIELHDSAFSGGVTVALS